MKHRATATFWRLHLGLPKSIQSLADKNFAILRQNPRDPSLQSKKVGEEVWSVRVGSDHRALALGGVDTYLTHRTVAAMVTMAR